MESSGQRTVAVTTVNGVVVVSAVPNRFNGVLVTNNALTGDITIYDDPAAAQGTIVAYVLSGAAKGTYAAYDCPMAKGIVVSSAVAGQTITVTCL